MCFPLICTVADEYIKLKWSISDRDAICESGTIEKNRAWLNLQTQAEPGRIRSMMFNKDQANSRVSGRRGSKPGKQSKEHERWGTGRDEGEDTDLQTQGKDD